MKKPALGSGKRFSNLKKKLARKGKYGAKKMATLSARGRKAAK